MLRREEIRIRDPFVLTDRANGCYYMYGTTALEIGGIGAKNSFAVYKSRDLECFEEPVIVFQAEEGHFWATRDFWAPEVHAYNGKYYLFGSGIADGVCRGTNVFVSDTPDGHFTPVANHALTPPNWECLDGTLFVEDGIPYMVFSHEWVQVGDGEICAVQLSEDLTASVGEPFLLFHASDDPHVTAINGADSGQYVTDGPFLFRENGKLKMIWSSFSHGKYAVLEAESDCLRGQWTHRGSRFDFDGGHAMLFETLQGERMISLHRPNHPAGAERAFFCRY